MLQGFCVPRARALPVLAHCRRTVWKPPESRHGRPRNGGGRTFGGEGGPEGKLRGRPPPPVEPRSGPWRRTGSESGAGRARTRRILSIRRKLRDDDGAARKLGL